MDKLRVLWRLVWGTKVPLLVAVVLAVWAGFHAVFWFT